MENTILLTGKERENYIAERFGSPDSTEENLESGFDPAEAMTGIGDGPAIYMGFWGCYNEGDLAGNWIDLEKATTAEEIEECIKFLRNKYNKTGNDSRFEEWMIQDHQNLPKCLQGENPKLDDIELFLTNLEEVGLDNIEPYIMACDNQHSIIDEDDFRECFHGVFSSEEDFCQEWHDDLGSDLGLLKSHIDWSSVWRDLSYSGWHSERLQNSGDVAIFGS